MKGKPRNRLRVLRAERGMSQADLALKAGLTPSRYWKIENDVPPGPTDDERARLARALRIQSGSLGFPEIEEAQAS